jgi:hypothetical protein
MLVDDILRLDKIVEALPHNKRLKLNKIHVKWIFSLPCFNNIPIKKTVVMITEMLEIRKILIFINYAFSVQ